MSCSSGRPNGGRNGAGDGDGASHAAAPEVDLIRFTFGPVHFDAGDGQWRSLFDQPAI